MPESGENQEHINENASNNDASVICLGESPPSSPAINFDPVIQLPLVDVPTNEEEEVEMIKLRAKLYRYDTTDTPAEWKERGTGDVKLLRHETKNTVRVVMRREKTLKICANHFVWPWMELNPNCGSDRAWVWSALADFADESPKPQLLAIRFGNAENAKLWKEAFDKAKKIVETECEAYSGKPSDESENESSDSDSENNSKLSLKDVIEETKDEKAADNVTEEISKLQV